MSSIGTGYDLSSTTYSPDGKVFQIEYATKAVDNGGRVRITAVGIRCADGVVMAVEKLVISKMMVEGSNRRIHSVDRHAGVAVAGLAPDGRVLVNRARSEAAAYLSFYGDRIPATVLADRLASFIHLYTLYWSVRPFGAAVLLAVADAPAEGASAPTSASLFSLEPSGSVHKCFGAALGKGRAQARTEVERLQLATLSCADAVLELAKIVHRCHDEKDKAFELELSWVCAQSGWMHAKVPPDVAHQAEEQAKAAIAAAAMED